MTRLPWETVGARLQMPRDLAVAFVVARMGAVRVADIAPLFWRSLNTARFGFARLLKLGLLRTFARRDPSHPAWYAVHPDALEWIAEQSDCAVEELRCVSGLARTNTSALAQLNTFWVSVILACRAAPSVRLALFRPEWELRRFRTEGLGVVPDAQVALHVGPDPSPADLVFFVECDSGSERNFVWTAKAKNYGALRGRPSVYGASRWQILVLVPTARRAFTVATAVDRAGAGAGSFVYIGVHEDFAHGQALTAPCWRAGELAASREAVARWTLLGLTPSSEGDQRGPKTADEAFSAEKGTKS